MLVVRLVDESAGFLPSAALESFRADLGLTYAQAGTVLAAIAPGTLVGTAFTAAADRYSRRAIAAGGAIAFAACLVAFAAGASFAVLAAASFALGAASTAMVDAAEVALVDLAGDDHLRPFLTRSNLLAAIGDVLGPALVAAVAFAGWSWRTTFWIGAALVLLYGLALATSPLPPPARPQGDAGEPSPSSLGTLAQVLRDRRVWTVALMSLLMGPFDEPLVAFTIALLEQERGASAAVATLVALVGVSGGFVTFAFLAPRVASVDEGRLLVRASVAMTAGAALIALFPHVLLVAPAAFVVSVGLSLAWLALQHRTLTLRPGQVGTTKAVVSAIEIVGFVMPVVIGAVADRTSLVVAVSLFALLGVALTVLARADSSQPLPDSCRRNRS